MLSSSCPYWWLSRVGLHGLIEACRGSPVQVQDDFVARGSLDLSSSVVQNKTPAFVWALGVDGVIDDLLTVVMLTVFCPIINYPFHLEISMSSRDNAIVSSDKYLLIYPTPDSTPQGLVYSSEYFVQQ